MPTGTQHFCVPHVAEFNLPLWHGNHSILRIHDPNRSMRQQNPENMGVEVLRVNGKLNVLCTNDCNQVHINSY